MPKLAELIRDVGRADIPEDERFEANGELFKKAFLGSPYHDEIREALPDLLANEELTAKSAQLMTDRLTFRTEPSSERWKVHGRKTGKEHVSVLEVNEYGVVVGAGDRSRWIERSNSSFDFLKSMVASVDVIKAVILTRQRQVIPFLRPERDQGPLGFHFVGIEGRWGFWYE